ncbi:FkbM family methyltransferase [Methylobacterium nigriterrae]|uniref:FkbM family methyltransferase n=1 Tax=Methylobacterium nigriterrae TaxID=3127512 RepID=UPI003013618C
MANLAIDLKPKNLASTHRALKIASKMILRDDRILLHVKSIKLAVEASLLRSICVYDRIIPLLPKIIGKKDPTLLDVGANMGQFALRVARQFPDGRIYSFEPLHESAMGLRRAKRWLRLGNISVHEEALCDAVGTEIIHVPVMNGGFRDGALAVLEGSKTVYDNVSYQAEAVKTNTIDAFTMALGLDRIDFIKVDTEGAESRVISGGLATIDRLLPTLYLETPLERPWLTGLYERGYQPFYNDGEKLFAPRAGMRQTDVLLVHSSKTPQIAGLRADK